MISDSLKAPRVLNRIRDAVGDTVKVTLRFGEVRSDPIQCQAEVDGATRFQDIVDPSRLIIQQHGASQGDFDAKLDVPALRDRIKAKVVPFQLNACSRRPFCTARENLGP
ncbi:hypothetical protein LTR81_002971, partial [Elasticomyces elasticus]